jgi:hypothetical protein
VSSASAALAASSAAAPVTAPISQWLVVILIDFLPRFG